MSLRQTAACVVRPVGVVSGVSRPNTTNHRHVLRNRRHNYAQNIKTVTDDRNFITRLAYFLKTCRPIDYYSIHSLAVFLLFSTLLYKLRFCQLFIKRKLEMWANAQLDGRPAEYRWRPLFNAAKFG